MYIALIILAILSIAAMFTTTYVREKRNKNSHSHTSCTQNTRQPLQIDEKIIKRQYHARAKVIFEGIDRNVVNNVLGALQMKDISAGESKFLEYFSQSLFFDNTRVEDCVALKILIEKYLNLETWHTAIRVLEERIR